MATESGREAARDPFAALQSATRQHRQQHGCGAYTFEDGAALIRLAAEQRPTRILELGTALGYTACCMAHGSPGAHVDTVEGDPTHARLARAEIAGRGLAARITIHEGDFEAVLPTLQAGYDMVFFDGFAPSLSVLEQLRALLVAGGLLVCSNVQLSEGNTARQLAKEFADPSRWQPRPSIEGGRTVVLTKRAT